MRHSAVLLLTAIVVRAAAGFSLAPKSAPRHPTTIPWSRASHTYCSSASNGDSDDSSLAATASRSEFLVSMLSTWLGAVVIVGGSSSMMGLSIAGAEDVAPPESLTGCSKAAKGPSNCVATASVKQVDNYAPPWTFQVSGDEALARIKGVVESDTSLELLEASSRYIKVKATRNLVVDEMEFLINDVDQVVTFRSAETGEPSISDFGANRSRLDSIRKRAGVFGVMGEGLTADSYDGNRGSGPLGQLKTFYGLQSGKGFEQVFED